MYWYFEALPVPQRTRYTSSGGASSSAAAGLGAEPPSKATLKQVWRDQSLVEKATRKDNLHLQVCTEPDTLAARRSPLACATTAAPAVYLQSRHG